jgi:hypothetical protein
LTQIFNSKILKAKKISTRKLYAILGIMLLVEFLMDAVATWKDNITVGHNPADPVQSYVVCNTSDIYFIPWVAYKVRITRRLLATATSLS